MPRVEGVDVAPVRLIFGWVQIVTVRQGRSRGAAASTRVTLT